MAIFCLYAADGDALGGDVHLKECRNVDDIKDPEPVAMGTPDELEAPQRPTDGRMEEEVEKN